jgi:hypothetical protein
MVPGTHPDPSSIPELNPFVDMAIPRVSSVEMMHNALYDALCSLPYAVHRRLAH